MAPDKIFLHKVRDEESSGYHKMWFESRGRLVPSEEYIRKEALLAFLNERRKGLTSGDSFVAGERKMLKEIIEKIESL